MEAQRSFLAIKLSDKYEVYEVYFSPLLERFGSTYHTDENTGVKYIVYWRVPNSSPEERMDVTQQISEYLQAKRDYTGEA